MGYEVYITRKEYHSDDDGPDISINEWIEFVTQNSEFSLVGFAEAALPGGEFLRVDSEGLAVWEAYSRNENRRGGNKAWFQYSEGSITVKNPDNELLAQMHETAQLLGAKVQGEEGEVYGPDGIAETLERRKQPGVFSRLAAKLSVLFGRSPTFVNAEDLPFIVGSEVRDSMGKTGTVVNIDVKAERGMGVVTIQYRDGELGYVSAVAHGLEVVES